MLNRTRVGGHMDTSRLGASVARPGIDTRTWASLAVALGESNVDAKSGVYVDVQLVPSGEKYTARVATSYEGNGFGLYFKIHEGDELLVVIPGGEAAQGPVVVQRLWTGADLPPQAAHADMDEVVLVVEKDRNLRVSLSGTGQVNLVTAGDGRVTVKVGNNVAIVKSDKIELGADGAADKAVLDSKVQAELTRLKGELSAFKSTFDGHTHILAIVAAAGAGGTGTAAPPVAGFPAPADPGDTSSSLVTINS